MRLAKINELIIDKISGEWGEEANGEPGVNVLRTTNFTNIGKLNLASVVKRKISKDIVAKKKLSTGDVLIEKSGGSPTQPVGRVVFFDVEGEDYLCNNFTAVLRPSKDVYPKYFFYALYFLHLSKRTLKYQNKTTGILNLKLERYLEEEQIRVPDLQTQKQIAQLLEEADTARQKRKAANALTDQFLQSTFLSMFGDPSKNDKGWETGTIRDIITEAKYGTSKPAEENGKYPYLRMNNIDYRGNWDFASLKYINLEEGERDKYLLKKGDVVFNRTNSKELVGKTGIYDREDEMAIAGYLIRMRTNEKANPYYLWAYLNSKHGKSVLFAMCKNIVGMANINAQELQNIPIQIPPLELQQKFASIVADTEALRQRQKESERELENLFQALLQKYYL
jgi:type I restriction enzyme S subunit